MNTIFLSDLDGTLLDDGACLPVSVRQELAGLLGRGLPFTVATGRTHLSVGPIFQGLPMAVPWVLMNGALILAPSDGAVLDRVPLGKTAWRELVRAEEELGLSGLLLGTEGDRLHATLGGTCTPIWEAFFRRNHVTGPPPVSAGRAEDWDGEDLLYGIYIHPQMALLTELARRLTAHIGTGMTGTPAVWSFIAPTPPRAERPRPCGGSPEPGGWWPSGTARTICRFFRSATSAMR